MFLSEKYLDDLIRQEYRDPLPLGFAERVASLAMERSEGAFWGLLLQLSPRFGLAAGALALVLLVLGATGEGPGIFESISNYASLTQFLPLQ